MSFNIYEFFISSFDIVFFFSFLNSRKTLKFYKRRKQGLEKSAKDFTVALANVLVSLHPKLGIGIYFDRLRVFVSTRIIIGLLSGSHLSVGLWPSIICNAVYSALFLQTQLVYVSHFTYIYIWVWGFTSSLVFVKELRNTKDSVRWDFQCFNMGQFCHNFGC